MMKWLGLLLVVCSGGGIGFLYAMRLRQERTNLERLCQMLREIAVQIAFRSLTVQELLEQLCRETAYAAFQFPVMDKRQDPRDWHARNRPDAVIRQHG